MGKPITSGGEGQIVRARIALDTLTDINNWTEIPWDTSVSNDGGITVDLANNGLRPDEDGEYFSAIRIFTVVTADAENNLRHRWYVNGGLVWEHDNRSTPLRNEGVYFEYWRRFTLSANDLVTFEMDADHNNNPEVGYQGADHNYFDLVRVG